MMHFHKAENYVRTTDRPTSRSNDNNAAAVILSMVQPEVRRSNLRLFDELASGIIESLGDTPKLRDVRPRARVAIARLPIVLLAPGMLNKHKTLENGNENIANLMEVIVETDRLLRSGACLNVADALIRACAIVLGGDLEDLRLTLLHCINECEFFSPEIASMLEVLAY